MAQIIVYSIVFYPMAGAFVSYLIGRRSKEGRNYFADFITVTEFLLALYAVFNLRGTEAELGGVCGMGLMFTEDGFRGIYICVLSFMWMMTMIFSREYFTHYRNRNRYYLFQLLTLGATAGVFLSASLFTTFIFFEIMSFTSYVWVAQDERQESLRAAGTYLAVAVIGGMVLLMGLFLLYSALGTLTISELPAAAAAYPNKARLYVAGGCALVGFGAKAGAFPLHIWLPKAHPVAPAPASALLSGILTKAGVYGILILSCYLFFGDEGWGTLILVLGLITMVLGAVLALFSVDIKRTLACSSMSQIGFILVGIAMMCLLGEESSLAVQGTFLHMMNHSLIKLVLFMAAGVIFMNLHKLDLNEIRGFGRGKPFLNFCFLMGALGISGIPLWNGYISKTLLHESIVEFSTEPVFVLVEWIFLISGGLTLAYMTKLYVCVFIEKNADPAVQAKYDSLNHQYMNKQTTAVLGISALVLPILGMTPYLTMTNLSGLAADFFRVEELGHLPEFFGLECLEGAAISIAIGVAVYFLIVRKLLYRSGKHAQAGTLAAGGTYLDLWPKWLDLENLVYRPLILTVLPAIGQFVCRVADSLMDSIVVFLRKTVYKDAKVVYKTGTLPQVNTEFGKLLDKGEAFLRNREEQDTFQRRFKERSLEREERSRTTQYSISYGLMLTGLGLVLILLYLLF